MTQTLSPRATRAAFRTAPTPVTTAHPTSAACQSGRVGGIGTAQAAGTTQRSAKQPTARNCLSGSPFARWKRVVPSSSESLKELWPARSQRFPRPVRHRGHSPQEGTKQSETGSPGATAVVVGLAPVGVDAAVPAIDFLSEKSLRGSFYGSGNPAREIAELARLVDDGRFDVAHTVSHLTDLDGLEAAFGRLRRGEGARTVAVIDPELAGAPEAL